MFQLTVWSVPSMLAVTIAIIASRRVWQNRTVPGVKALRWLLVGIGLWSLGQFFGSVFTTIEPKIWAARLQWLGIVITPLAWFVFAITYSRGIRQMPMPFLVTLSVIPAITVLLALTDGLHGLIYTSMKLILRDGYVGLKLEYGIWFQVAVIYSYALVFGATTILAFTLSQSRTHIFPLVSVIAAPLTVAAFNLVHLSPFDPTPGYDITPLSFAISALILYRGVLLSGLLDTLPVVRHRVVEKLTDAVMVVSRDGRIVDSNPSALNMLSIEPTVTLASRVDDVISNSTLLEMMHGTRSSAEITIKNRAYDVITTRLNDKEADSEIVLVFRDITSRRQAEEDLRNVKGELERLAHTDPLTGLYNRRFFIERLNEESERVRRHGSSLSVVLYDLDHFKRINDTHGHETGDRVLREVTRVAQAVKRVTDVAARVGGEEFAFLLPETHQDGAIKLAQRLRKSIETAFIIGPNGGMINVTASIGVATVNQMGQISDEPESLLNTADRALYRAKNSGRNMVCTADS